MDKNTKIIISVLSVLLVAVIIYIIVLFCPKSEKTNVTPENEMNNQISTNSIKEQNATNGSQEDTTNISEETNSVEENETQNGEQSQTEQNNQIAQGKEEEESNKENQGINQEEKAIQLAKKAWGEGADVYQFAIDNAEGNIYTVAVRSANTSGVTTIAYYKVNVETEEVTQK